MVTFIVPCHRLAHLLPECVKSILSQSYRDFEILIMDDASPDDTPGVARSFGDPRVRHVRHPQNLGHLANYNAGLRLAQGRYVWLISADDRLHDPGALARAMAQFDKHPDLSYVFSPAGALKDGRTDGVVPFSWKQPDVRVLDGRAFLTSTLLQRNVIPSPSCIARTACYDHAGGFSPDMPYAGDWYLWCRFACEGRVAFLPDPLADYRLHEGSMTQALSDHANPRIVADEILVRWRILRDAEAAGWSDVVRAARTAIVADYVDRLELWSAPGSRAGLTRIQVDESIRRHAADAAEERLFGALIAARFGDRAYGAGDWIEARQHYCAALRGGDLMPRVRLKRSLLALGPVGAVARRTAARLRARFSTPRA